MPVRYILAANHVKRMNVNAKIANDSPICQYGTPYGILNIIAIGDVNGIIDNQILKLLFGALAIVAANIIDNIIGAEIGSVNCCVSVSLSHAEPVAANIDA